VRSGRRAAEDPVSRLTSELKEEAPMSDGQAFWRMAAVLFLVAVVMTALNDEWIHWPFLLLAMVMNFRWLQRH
jgi:hypothetical protein